MEYKKKQKPRSIPKERAQEQEIKCLKCHLVWSNQCLPYHLQYNIQHYLRQCQMRTVTHLRVKISGPVNLPVGTTIHYVNPPVFSSCLPFTPETVIIDAMFIINTRPLQQTNIVAEYVHFLFNRFTLATTFQSRNTGGSSSV